MTGSILIGVGVMMSISETIWSSAQNIEVSVAGFTSLHENIALLMGEHSGDLLIHSAGEHSPGANKWSCAVYDRRYTIRKNARKNGKSAGSITISLQLTCADKGGNWPNGRQAKVIAGYSPEPDDFWIFEADGFDTTGMLEGAKSAKWRWDWTDDLRMWFFAVPLGALKNESDVRRLLVVPLMQMIGGESAEVALGGISSEICMPPSDV